MIHRHFTDYMHYLKQQRLPLLQKFLYDRFPAMKLFNFNLLGLMHVYSMLLMQLSRLNFGYC